MLTPGVAGKAARTGIDLGTKCLKLVRGVGGAGLERVTHVGIEDWDPPAEGVTDEERAAAALLRLIERLKLGRNQLGRIAVAISSEAASVREVSLPVLSEEELRRALPFEAKKHLFLEGMDSPCFDFQILGRTAGEGENPVEEMRVLLVAAPRPVRDFPIRTLARLGLEPEVVDLEPLAGLNALIASHPLSSPEKESGPGLGFLDLGAGQARLHLVHPQGGFLTRSVGPGVSRDDAFDLSAFAGEVGGRIRETITFYRGRYRRGVEGLFVAGGGAMIPGVSEHLAKVLDLPVTILNPLKGVAESARGVESVAAAGARLVTAFGLCRWWDGMRV